MLGHPLCIQFSPTHFWIIIDRALTIWLWSAISNGSFSFFIRVSSWWYHWWCWITKSNWQTFLQDTHIYPRFGVKLKHWSWLEVIKTGQSWSRPEDILLFSDNAEQEDTTRLEAENVYDVEGMTTSLIWIVKSLAVDENWKKKSEWIFVLLLVWTLISMGLWFVTIYVKILRRSR